MGKQADGGGQAAPSGISVATTPRAAGSVRRLKSWGGLVGFGLVYLVSWRQGLPAADSALRALIGGVAGSMAAWAAGVAIWRHLLRAQAAAAARAAAAQREQRHLRRPSGEAAT
jgi:hypothetical protein